MTRRTNQDQRNNIRIIAIALLFVATSMTTRAAQDVVSGVRNSTGLLHLNAAELQQLRASLRLKSGFVELDFDEQGALKLGNRQHIQRGSATARALLIAAVDSTNRYELESHKDSPEVAFARLDESEIYETAGQKKDIYQVQLDFTDFSWLSGPREAKAAFDIGIALLHELAHGVLKLQDPQGAMDQIGECEAHVNQMRRELDLPERLYYHPDIKVVTLMNEIRFVRASLPFVARTQENTRPSATYQLYWLASKVSSNAKNIAELEKGLLGVRRR